MRDIQCQQDLLNHPRAVDTFDYQGLESRLVSFLDCLSEYLRSQQGTSPFVSESEHVFFFFVVVVVVVVCCCCFCCCCCCYRLHPLAIILAFASILGAVRLWKGHLGVAVTWERGCGWGPWRLS